VIQKLRKAVANPVEACRILASIIRGGYWRLRCNCLSQRIKIGKGFRVVGKFMPNGPGTLHLGNGVFSHGGPHPVTLFTHTRQAKIVVGNNVTLNGARFGCSELIEVGDDCILADCRIFDTDMHSTSPNRHLDEARVATAPVRLQRNVWIGAAAIILKGVTVGENSVVGAGAVVSHNVPANVIVAGNPARVVRRLSEAE
jgi:acetyltransferase-like isoleucine patch superfamily enzyme